MNLTSLEGAFKKACKRHPNLKLLESQWRFDKELISKALQNIGTIFPHYSRHDSSHSKQIVVNIERLLGEKIHNLTATDMWLILEAAYTHDIGMVVTHRQIQDMDTPEFADFVRDISTQQDHNLYIFSQKWLTNKAILPTGAAAHIFLNEYIQLIAEWYRVKHPENSAKIIRNPYSEIGLDSPRNELLPKRLFGALASICNAHGQSFEEVMKLPFSEAGMATEDCHPRYIAFLLRMGDLLDVDDNRFCPVMMKMNGSKLPETSHTHFEKHQSITHFRLDSERIEIEAECPSPEAYEVAYEWFNWLEKEHNQQLQQWHKIAPGKKLGRLPTLSPPNVTIKSPYIIVTKGKKPEFSVDNTAILNLLRSTGLYTSKFDSIREILQNAVDSTITAIWIDNKETISKLNPTSPALNELYEARRINVEFTQDLIKKDLFLLSVTDKGTGISEDDLRFMLQAGSSNKNKRKTKITQEMPIWYKPSGVFGIGLQSIYLLSDSFSITTKSIFTHKALKIKFSKGKEHTVVIERLPSDSVEYGAVVELKLKMEEFPDRISIPWGVEGKQLLAKLNEFDFTKPDSSLIGYEEIRVIMAIHEFNKKSPIKIKSSGTPLEFHKDDNIYFCPETNIVLSEVVFSYSDYGNFETLFRGQPFKDLSPSLMLVSCCVDFYGEKAIEFLSYNREKIIPQAKSKAAQDLITSILNYIDDKFDSLHADRKPCAAAFYFLYSRNESKLKYKEYVFQYKVDLEGNTTRTLSEIVEEIKSRKICEIEIKPEQAIKESEPISTNENSFVLSKRSSHSCIRLILYFATEQGVFWQESAGSQSTGRGYKFSLSDIEPIEKSLLKKMLADSARGFEIGNRALFPTWGPYKKLALNEDIRWARIFRHDGFNPEYLVLPCTFNADGGLDKFDTSINFLEWAYSNRKDETVTLTEVQSLYAELVNYLTSIMAT